MAPSFIVRNLLGALGALLVAAAVHATPTCPDRSTVEQARAADQREALLPALVQCLGSTDPTQRDALGFETLSLWLRGKQLGPNAHLRLLAELEGQWLLDDNGVRRSFVLLSLAEVARSDRIQPWLSTEGRRALLDSALQRVQAWSDYRDFDDTVGWRHGIAHGADLLLQLALHPAHGPAEQAQILTALGSQVLAQGQHAYQAGEGARLARATIWALIKSDWNDARWRAHLQRLAGGLGPDTNWSRARLIRLHNWREFLWPLYVALQEQPDAALKARYLPALQEQLRRLP
ncbi:DUF2785 domain-containing protein [Inhella gelatinilytica]|uniref:DUF2785 domain-containing protein n=1 Tax=Inhella gelatinilytica TaxID=2795030 RepID=A0A931IZ59_9BURK|nr:DUF2785 domain-containing protein [Inhella gelatinilytica]MBH9553784.1 DUF2785 domain-containing protein [Inhella gelatinilytica]